MRCPFCQNDETKVIDKRSTPDFKATRRRRECLKCGRRVTTYERVEDIELYVIKKDKSRKPFDRTKILFGIQRACEKRPVNVEQMQGIVEKVEQELLKMETQDIPTTVIGELVMKELKKLDDVAYIRFASVYRSFQDVDEFYDEVSKIMKKGKK